MGGPIQLLHGLRLGGDVRVPGAATVAAEDADFDVRVEAASTMERSAPDGEVVATLDGPGRAYAAWLDGDVLTVRFLETCEYRIGLAGGPIVVRPAPGRGEAMVPVLLAGNVLALVLGLRGAAVLHASTVELEGVTVAFAGSSGAGKSTAAALLCAAGATLYGDDTARVEDREGALFVHPGPAELRLRPSAAALAECLNGATRVTADGRIAVSTGLAVDEPTPLGAVVFPHWSASTRRAAITRLTEREALESLLGCPRVIGWVAKEPIRTHFEASTRIAEAVPAFRADLPRERIDDPRLGSDLLLALRDRHALDTRIPRPR